MDKLKKSIILGGLTVAGIVTASYRAYKLKKLRDELQEQEVIDISPEVPEEANPQK